MRAWLLPGYTDIGSMTIGDAPEPVAGPGQVVLAVDFAALNPADHYLSIGQYPGKPKFPHILGRDGVGVVAAVGEGVTSVRVGEARAILRSEVGVNRPGTLAQRVVVDETYLTEVPEGWLPEQAAAAPLVYLTAWQALTQWGELAPQSTILVTGASGGVGVATVQLAHALDCTVVALSRSVEKSAKLRALGADVTLNPENSDWRKQLTNQLGARPIHVAVDNIGGAQFPELLETLGMWGKLSVVGRLAGPVPNFNTASLFFRRLQVGGVSVGSYTNAETVGAWRSILATLAKTGARPLIDHVFDFLEVPAAFARLAQGPMGKVVVRIPQE